MVIYTNVWQRENGDQFVAWPPTPFRSILDGRTLWTKNGEKHPRRIGVLHIRMMETDHVG